MYMALICILCMYIYIHVHVRMHSHACILDMYTFILVYIIVHWLLCFQVSSGDAVEGKTKDTASPGDTNESMESCVDEQMETDSTEPSKSKKRVTWAPSDALVNVQYFEVDEEERG